VFDLLGKRAVIARVPPLSAWQLLNWRTCATAFRLFTQSEAVAIFFGAPGLPDTL
jgi:hypothetical protein